MKKSLLAVALLGAFPLAAAAQVSKEDIRKLAAAGISDDVILTYIRTHGPVQVLSADDMVELKKAGVTDRVLGVLAGGSGAATETVPLDRNVYAPSATYVVDATPTVYYYGSSWYGGWWPYRSYIWPTYCYSPWYSYPRHSHVYPYSGHTGYPRPPSSYSSIRTAPSPAPVRSAPAPAPPRSYSTIRRSR